MRAGAHRTLEMVFLSCIAFACLGVAAYMVYLGRMGEAFGSLIGIVPLCVNAIRQLSQSQAMQALADHLAKSRPDGSPPPVLPVPDPSTEENP